MADNPKRKRPARKAPASKTATTGKRATMRATAGKLRPEESSENGALAGRRVIAARPPARREPPRGSLRDRFRTAPVTGTGGGDADVVAVPPAAPSNATAGALRRGAVAVATGSRQGNLVRELRKRKPVVTGPSGRPDREQREPQRDESFGKVLASRDIRIIGTECLKRLEGARLTEVKTGVQAAEAELRVLRLERERLEQQQDTDRLALIDGYIRLVAAEAHAGRSLLKLATTARRQKGVMTLVGRVLAASGKPAADAQVFFVDEKGEIVKNIAPIKPDDEGLVWVALDKEQARMVIQRGGRLSARAQVSGKVVAADPFTARMKEGSVYQFDLRVRDDSPVLPGVRPGKPPRGRESRRRP